MPTRFYFGASAVPTQTPAFSSWTITTTADRRLMRPWRDGSTIASKVSDQVGAAAPRTVLNRQFVCPIGLQGGQTLSGNIKCQVRGNMSSITSRTGNTAISIKVFSHDGTTLRATLLDNISTGAGTDYTTTLTNRQHPASTAISSYTTVEDDILVVEIGWRYKTGSTTTTTATHSFGASSATDLAEDNTTTTANNPWIEFDMDIRFVVDQVNLMTYPTEDLNTSYGLTATTITTDAVQAPDARLTGDKIVETAATNFHQLFGSNLTLTDGEQYCYSVFVKSAEKTTMVFSAAKKDGGFTQPTFDLTTGVSTSTDLNPVGSSQANGWYRVSFTVFIVAGGTTPYVYLQFPGGSYLGNGVDGFYAWGMMVNRGITPANYIPSTTRIRNLSATGTG